MRANYSDILSRVKEEPHWWDENGVPRWGRFYPHNRANIYSREVKYILVECQFCKYQFKVCISKDLDDEEHFRFENNLYGDPPNVDCCGAGASANSNTLMVIEHWMLDNNNQWRLV